jgi:FtsP/CotA-like multicopper oxidase with cupredoxin domain
MMNRRRLFSLGLGSTALSLSPWARGQSALRPATTPFLDPLPLPPAPRELDWLPGRLPFADLSPQAAPYVDPGQKKGKAGFYRIVSEVRSVKFHSQLPPTEIWGYRDGNLPPGETWDYALGPTFKRYTANDAYSGTIVRHENQLPPASQHRGFGEPRTTVHLHGGHHPALFDGYPTDMTMPDGTPFNVTFERGEHYDYAYPMVDPGFIDDTRAGTNDKCLHSERSSMLWYHDHILDFTSQNVYRGLVGMFLAFDNPVIGAATPADIAEQIRDTGDELNTANAPNALRLPSGKFDIPMVFHEKTFGANGELIYDVFDFDGFLGENYLVNGMVQPYLNVKRRKYRLRFLNGSNARIYQMFLADKNGKTYPMTQIATEGGLLSRPVTRKSFMIAMAERVEVVVDFSLFPFPQFSELYIENRMIQDGGRGPDGKFDRPKLSSRGTQLLQFRLEEAAPDPSQVPASLRPFPTVPAAELSGAPIRNFEFGRGNGQWQINGRLAGDLSRTVARPTLGRGEIWRLINKSGGWWHPIHVHHEFMRVLKRDGKLPYDGTGTDYGQSLERDGLAKKDTIVLGPNSEVEVFVKFRDFTGPYVFHCHNLEHEDHAMMARFDVV